MARGAGGNRGASDPAGRHSPMVCRAGRRSGGRWTAGRVGPTLPRLGIDGGGHRRGRSLHRRDPSRLVPHPRCPDGGRLHAGLPRAGARRGGSQRGLPAPVRPGEPLRAGRLVPNRGHDPVGRAHVRPVAALGGRRGAHVPGPPLGTTPDGVRRHRRGAGDPHPSGARCPRMGRCRGPRPVGPRRRVRVDRTRFATVLGAGRVARRARVGVQTRPRGRCRSRRGRAVVGEPRRSCGWRRAAGRAIETGRRHAGRGRGGRNGGAPRLGADLGVDRVRDRPDTDARTPGSGRRLGLGAWDAHRPGVPPPGRSAASGASLVDPDRWRAAATRTAGAAPLGPRHSQPVPAGVVLVLAASGRRGCRGGGGSPFCQPRPMVRPQRHVVRVRPLRPRTVAAGAAASRLDPPRLGVVRGAVVDADRSVRGHCATIPPRPARGGLDRRRGRRARRNAAGHPAVHLAGV